ncbi:hypothetical protein C8J56DRAFT_821970 [Mycena floridula]|nr:hypothetical protein C8J56DRAFT_821970 [Mycena floridula]
MLFSTLTLAALAASAFAKTLVVKVGANTTDNATTIFQPEIITASVGDVVTFDFTAGNHTATQSKFAVPCVSAPDGFQSNFHSNGTFNFTVKDTKPVWFFDFNTCALGGVGGINVNQSSNETIQGFVRNAIRLNGTESNTSSISVSASATASGSGSGSVSGSASATGSGATGSSTNSAGGSTPTSSAQRTVIFSVAALVPLFILSALTL